MHTIQMLNSSIWLMDRTLSFTPTPGQSGPESSGNEGVFHIPQSFKNGATPSDSVVLIIGQSLWRGGGSTLLQRCSWYILQLQLSGLIFWGISALMHKNLGCLPMVWETRVQSQIESYQRFKKWYLMLPP